MNKVAKTLIKARNIMQERGFYKGALNKYEGGPCCILGALGEAITGPGSYEHFDDARDTIISVLPNGETRIPTFNDLPSTNKRKALAILDAAASLALSNKV